MSDTNPLEIAIAASGGIRSFTEHLGITPQAVSLWRKRGVPAARVLDIESISQGKATRYELRPDVFGQAPNQAA